MLNHPLLRFVASSVLYGLLIAGVLLLVLPNFNNGSISNGKILDRFSDDPAPVSFSRAVSRAAPSVVNIYSVSLENRRSLFGNPVERTSLGSGVIMNQEGYILTNYHVVRNASVIQLLLQDGRRLVAELIGTDPGTDLAVLKVEADNLPVIPQHEDIEARVGDLVLAIGNPLNLGQTITQGIVSATGRHGLGSTYSDFLQMDAAITEGNSGGALVNSNGVLVGINTANYRSAQDVEVQGIYFAVPFKLAHKVMNDLITKGRVVRGYLGVAGNTYARNADNQHGISSIYGFEINSITPGGPAHKSGLQTGDIIMKMGDTSILSAGQARDLIAETTPGTQLNFTLLRANRIITLPVIVEELR